MNEALNEIIVILEQVRDILQAPGTDILWSAYDTAEEVIQDIDNHIESLKNNDLSNQVGLCILFAPTGPLQEISLQSGWGETFLSLASQFDLALERIN